MITHTGKYNYWLEALLFCTLMYKVKDTHSESTDSLAINN